MRAKLTLLRDSAAATLKQVSDNTGLAYTWIRKVASEGANKPSDEYQRNKLTKLAQFFGLPSWRSWWNDDGPTTL